MVTFRFGEHILEIKWVLDKLFELITIAELKECVGEVQRQTSLKLVKEDTVSHKLLGNNIKVLSKWEQLKSVIRKLVIVLSKDKYNIAFL